MKKSTYVIATERKPRSGLKAHVIQAVVLLATTSILALLIAVACIATPTPTPPPPTTVAPTAVPIPTPPLTPLPLPTSTPTPIPTIKVDVTVEGAVATVIIYIIACTSPCSLDVETGVPFFIEVQDPPLPTGSRYVFTGWSDGGERRHEVRPTSSTTYTAYFKTQHELQVTSPHGTFTGGGWYDEGAEVTPSVTPAMIEERSETRRFHTGWSEALPITMTGPKVVTAIWKTQHKLTVLVSGSGKVNPSDGWFDEGSSVVLTPSPAGSGWFFDSFSTPSPVVMNAPREVTANFGHGPVTLTTNVNPPWAGKVSPNSGTYKLGDQVTLTAAPVPGWYLSSWRGDVNDIHNPLTITMDKNKTAIAVFFRYSRDVPLPPQPPTGPASPDTPSVTLLPIQPTATSSVLVSGAGWVQENTVFLDVFKAGATTPSISLKISLGAYGYFTTVFNLPADLEAGTTLNLVATDALSHKATTTFRVISGPSITVSPAVVSWGQTISISGRGFLPLSKMLYGLPWNGNPSSFPIPVYADSSGNFNTKIVMPTILPGARMIGVTDGTNLATTYIEVTEVPVNFR